MTVRIAITGAGGFVGRQLVPRLLQRGVHLLLIGRDPTALAARFPQCQAAGYDAIETTASGYDALLHLAVINNDQAPSDREIEQVNVALPVETCMAARAAGVRHFIFVSSSHALDEGNTTAYAISKRRAAARLAEVPGIALTTVHLPAVVGDELAGNLAAVGRLPTPLQGGALRILGALKPTVRIERVAEEILRIARGAAGASPRAVLVSESQRENLVYRLSKRAFDLGFAFAVVLLLWWLMVLIWLAVRLQSPGPGIFSQVRVGKDERPFTCYKFRTMAVSTPDVGTHDAPVAAVTALGRKLRKWKLDELPQVVNILANQMSLVGPRPCLPTQTELIEARRARDVFAATPGITGLAQINGVDMSEPEHLADWDARYIGMQSLLLDLAITVRTFLGGGRGDPIDKGSLNSAAS